MEEDEEVGNAVSYFKSRPGLHRMLVKVREKYQSLNHLGGSIQLTKLTLEEKDHLGAFFQKSLQYQKSLTIPVSKIEYQLARTRYAGLSFKEILDAYFEEDIIGNQVVKIQYLENREKNFLEWLEMFAEGKGKFWLEDALETDNPVRRYIYQKYKEDELNCFHHLSIVVLALNELPYKSVHPKKVAQFSAEITGDPHFFDVGSEGEKWLTFALASVLGKNANSIQSAEKRAELYFQFGLIRDTLFNFTFCYQIEVYKRGKEPHRGIRGNNLEDEAQIITLETLSQVEEVCCHKGYVYVVENPTVFHALVKERSSRQAVSLLCTNGQPNISSLVLLDLIVQAGQTIYYSGDFDPEGLRIAESLKSRYGSQLQFWRLTPDDYRSALSKKDLTPLQLKKLEKLVSEELIILAEMMKELKRAGYQESITQYYLDDINNF